DCIHNINNKSPLILSQAFAKHVGPDRVGKIINVNDARIPKLNIDHLAYRLSKRALWDLTGILALELAPHITVNQVALGAILPPPGKPPAYLEMIAEGRVPLKRSGNPRIVAENVIHLLKQDFLTGATIEIDGGEFV
ncbi:MAG: SDR family oxidoreductase, partial [Chloroflexota bacterium]